MSDSPPESLPPPAAPRHNRLMRALDPALWIAALAIAFAAWQWHDSRGEIAALREETAARLAAAGAELRDGRLAAGEARDAIAAAQAKLGKL